MRRADRAAQSPAENSHSALRLNPIMVSICALSGCPIELCVLTITFRYSLTDAAVAADFFVRDPSAFFTGEVRDQSGDVLGLTDTQRSALLK